MRPGASLSSLVTISISCLLTLTLLAAGATWLVPHGDWTSTTFTQRPASVASAQPQPASAFPTWVEVPHLTGPLSHADDPDTFSLADEPRTFLDPNPTDAVEQLSFLPPRANPRMPLISRAPLDATRLTHEQPPVWNERPVRQDIATTAPPSAVATLEPNVLQSLQDRVETRTLRTLPGDLTPTPILPPQSTEAETPTQVVVRPAATITAVPPPGRVTTLSPDAAPEVDQASPITLLRDAEGVVAPILNPGPARHARSLRRPRAKTAASRARVPYRDAEQTASIISWPTSARERIDAGAVAYASMHRARGSRSAVPPSTSTPSSPWTLPSALAPTD